MTVKKLKTLKDCSAFNYPTDMMKTKCILGNYELVICVDELRQEAIKWLKEYRRVRKECEHDLCYKTNIHFGGYDYNKGEQKKYCNEAFFRLENEQWITHFFNLTKEDLEEKK